MKILYIFITCIFFIIPKGHSQIHNETYYVFTDESYDFFKFENDSVLKVIVGRGSFRSSYQFIYKKNENHTFKIVKYLKENIIPLNKVKQVNFLIGREFNIEEKAIVDHSLKIIMVPLKNYSKKVLEPFAVHIAYIHKDQLIIKHGSKKPPKYFSKILKEKDFEIAILKGYEAYMKYGHNYIFGIIELKIK